MDIQKKLQNLPAVDEILKDKAGKRWISLYPRRFVLDGIREVMDSRRKAIVAGDEMDTTLVSMKDEMEEAIQKLSAFSLVPVINATGIVIHTNLGRSPLSQRVVENIASVARGYSTLEYDPASGKRGSRNAHVKRLVRTVTGAEDAIAVNNNAAAVMLCLKALAEGREVIVSRGELVEIGGSFRVPEVMRQSGAILKEVGATNKTHLRDYEEAIGENTALILKVHQSNFRMEGFTADVSIEELARLGKKYEIPVMYDVGSGCLIDMRPYGIHTEHTVQEIVAAGPDVVTFSGDKLLGGPQAGIIAGKADIIKALSKHQMLRALRLDKMTLAALEATLMDYVDIDSALPRIPTMRMLLERPEEVRKRARRIASRIKGYFSNKTKKMEISVVKDVTFSGGGALPAHEIPTYAVSVSVKGLSANALESRLRLEGTPPVIARIKDNLIMLDARSVQDAEVPVLAQRVKESLG
ncbi:MAG: L-seryl-tRNA(Sec) selenium transferase [Thermodesulfovibrionales bacterium]|nr:L-seryl-tRNA(Sec) selenium transferase [Thermodesulfovibrionales bacterium]